MNGAVGNPTSDASESYQGIACVSATLCFAAGTDVTANEGVLVPIHVSATPTLGAPVDVTSTLALHGATCPTPSTCFAVGDQFNTVARGVVVAFSVHAGAPKPGKVQSVAGTSGLSAVACLGAGACDATGLQTKSPDYGVVVGISLGRAGTAHKVSGMTSVDGIACIGRSLCYGLGTGASSIGAIEQLPATVVTRTSIRASSNPVTTHHRVAYTAIVAPPPSAGTVGFTSDGNTIAGCGAVVVRAGFARCVVTYDRPGTFVLRTTYSGDAVEIGSASKPVTETVASQSSH